MQPRVGNGTIDHRAPGRNTMRKFDRQPPREKMSALLQRIIKKLANLASASTAHAKTAVFHTFHENKVRKYSTTGLVSGELRVMK